MPTPEIWSLTVQDNKLYVKLEANILVDHGPVIGVQCHKQKLHHIKVKFLNEAKPRLLSLNSFSWDENSLCKKFQGCGNNQGFMKVWSASVHPHLDKSGAFNSSTRSSDQPQDDIDATCEQDTPDLPRKKRKSQNDTPPSMIPASKVAKIGSEINKANDTDASSESSMDAAIQKHFIGFYVLPVTSLIEPSDELLVRDKNSKHVEALKAEIKTNTTADVQPIVCILSLKDGENFDPSMKEGYFYETIGGNNSREAYKQLLEESPEMKKNRVFTHRLCSVYSKMERKLALRLASKHNRATAFYLETSTWDKIKLCHNLLIDMRGQKEQGSDSVMTRPPMHWKKSCAAVLAQTVEQLDDSMIYYLAALPEESFDVLKEIFLLFSKANLKGQSIPHSKKGTTSKPPDLKASNFKCLRGIELSVVHRLLTELKDKQISLREMSSECSSIKQLHKVQKAFVKGTNSSSWEDAQQKWPNFCTASQLEPFKKLSFSGSVLPEPFLRFCQRAVSSGIRQDDCTEGLVTKDGDDSFLITSKVCKGIFWKHDVKAINSEKLSVLLQNFGVTDFPGFSLAIFDFTDGKEEPNEEAWSAEEAKLLLLLVRALNYGVGLQNFFVIFIVPLVLINNISETVSPHGEAIQLAVCSFSDPNKGKEGTYRLLNESTYRLIIVRCGNPPPLSCFSENCFQFQHDAPYYAEGDQKPLNPSQKPVAFYERIMELFTMKEDWILDGLSGTGSSLIAALKINRNMVTIECNALQYLHSKLRTVSKLNNPEQETSIVLEDQEEDN